VERYPDHELGGMAGVYNLNQYVEHKTYVAYAIEKGYRHEADPDAVTTVEMRNQESANRLGRLRPGRRRAIPICGQRLTFDAARRPTQR
jgi:hypothetical protein